MLLTLGIHAMEIERRAQTPRLFTSPKTSSSDVHGADFAWADVVALHPDPAVRADLLTRPVAQTELYALAARVLDESIQASARRWQTASTRFLTQTAPALVTRVEALRTKVAGELTDMARAAADEADEVSRDLVSGQRLKVKRVEDVIEKMLRRRRRRFRWVRRAGWLAVEWVLVGFMWYVWFVVMLARILLGVAKAVGRVVRWLLWL